MLNTTVSVGGCNLLCLALSTNKDYEEKLKIIKLFLKKGIDVNCVCSRDKYNALHFLFSNIKATSFEFYMEATKLLVKHGIGVAL